MFREAGQVVRYRREGLGRIAREVQPDLGARGEGSRPIVVEVRLKGDRAVGAAAWPAADVDGRHVARDLGHADRGPERRQVARGRGTLPHDGDDLAGACRARGDVVGGCHVVGRDVNAAVAHEIIRAGLGDHLDVPQPKLGLELVHAQDHGFEVGGHRRLGDGRRVLAVGDGDPGELDAKSARYRGGRSPDKHGRWPRRSARVGVKPCATSHAEGRSRSGAQRKVGHLHFTGGNLLARGDPLLEPGEVAHPERDRERHRRLELIRGGRAHDAGAAYRPAAGIRGPYRSRDDADIRSRGPGIRGKGCNCGNARDMPPAVGAWA